MVYRIVKSYRNTIIIYSCSIAANLVKYVMSTPTSCIVINDRKVEREEESINYAYIYLEIKQWPCPTGINNI